MKAWIAGVSMLLGLLGGCDGPWQTYPERTGVEPAVGWDGARGAPVMSRPMQEVSAVNPLPRDERTGAVPPAMQATPGVMNERLQELAGYMAGSFSSELQANEDEAYMDLRVHTARIWAERTDGVWLYSEHAAAKTPEKPHRQRVYRVTGVDGATFKVEVFELADPAGAVGAWKDAGKLAGVKPESLKAREGCAVMMKRMEGAAASYAGGTSGEGCGSALKGARYATSEIVLTKDAFTVWERGFNEKGEQVWGPARAGYRFVRVTE